MAKSNQAQWYEEQNFSACQALRLSELLNKEIVDIGNRGDKRRITRRLHVERREAEMEEKLLKLKESQRFQAEKFEQDTKMVQEAQRLHNEKLLGEKVRQQLRESSEELKELEAKLKVAYSLKELDAQLHEKRLATVKEKNMEQHANKLLQQSWLLQMEEERKLECQELMRKRQYREDLQSQMVNALKKKQLLFEEFLIEKNMLDEVVRKIQEEDLQAEAVRMEKMKKTKQEMDDFRMAQMVWKEKEKQEREEENKRIMAYLEQQGHKLKSHWEEKRLQEEAKTLLSSKVAREIHQAEMIKKEREDIILALAEEEARARENSRRFEEIEKKLRSRADIRQSYRQQMQEQKERLEREALHESSVRQQMLDKMADDARLDRLTREAQRRRKLQFQHEVADIIEEKRVQRAEEMKRLIHFEELLKEQEKDYLKRVEAERLTMLREHAMKLLGYLPRGILRESDLPLLGPEFVDMYSAKKYQAPTS